MPATGAAIGTPASISDSDEPHTEAIDDDPFDDQHLGDEAEGVREVLLGGITGNTACSARAPCPISRRLGPRMKPVSPVENGAML